MSTHFNGLAVSSYWQGCRESRGALGKSFHPRSTRKNFQSNLLIAGMINQLTVLVPRICPLLTMKVLLPKAFIVSRARLSYAGRESGQTPIGLWRCILSSSVLNEVGVNMIETCCEKAGFR